MTNLRPYQQAAVDALVARGDKRLLLWWQTSAGKTLAAIAAAERVCAKRILVVCPAMARPTWTREFVKWSTYEPHPIVYGKERASLTKKQAALRDAAYAADVQIISFDLCHEESIVFGKYDMVIVDELHNLRNPLSLQSRAVRAVLNAHSGYALGLTATLIPTEVKNVWNQVDSFFPGWYGPRTKTGAHAWRFLETFCNRVEGDYGTGYFGHKPELLVDLKTVLEQYTHRVTEADFAHYLPPVNADVLWIDDKRTDAKVAAEWLDEHLQSVSHVALVCYHHKTAEVLQSVGVKCKVPTICITGADNAEKRQALIDSARDMERCIIVATSESIRESIDLSFVDSVLIMEWRVSPAAALQLAGRFARSNRTKTVPTCIRYVAHPKDEARAETLKSRIDAVNAATKADAKSELVANVFAPRELTEERLESMFDLFMSETHLSLQEDEDSDET